MHSTDTSRRTFLRYLASSPLLGGIPSAFGQFDYTVSDTLIVDPSEAVNVFDFEPVARRNLSLAHYTYLASGVDDGSTIAANRAGFDKIALRVRRLVDVRAIDTGIELFGTQHALPIVIAPCGTQQAFHPEGELATARASRSRDCLQILSTVSSYSVDDVNSTRGAPAWFQLYATEQWDVTEQLVRRAEGAGCPAIALTVDLPASNREALRRFRRDSNEECQACHVPGFENSIQRRPNFNGIDTSTLSATRARNLDWAFVERLRDFTSTRLLLKGIVTAEDAALAVEHGVDGLIVSNHGGRAENSGRGTIESLPEVVDSVRGRVPILVDGGFRRGVDVFKALAIGADAVCIGRPYLWGLSSFGQQGVEAVLDLLGSELVMMMQQAGTTNLDAINDNYLVR
jgi:isopentenyl diphosphate isomerase/L-lactate dehydrogenase-like FMN-dependent dehydrogenase